MTLSLTDRILNAKSEQEIRDLLTEGSHYEDAAADTKRRWKRKAEYRRRQLKEQE